MKFNKQLKSIIIARWFCLLVPTAVNGSKYFWTSDLFNGKYFRLCFNCSLVIPLSTWSQEISRQKLVPLNILFEQELSIT